MLLRIIAVLSVMCPLLQSQSNPQVGRPAPDFTLVDATGSHQTFGPERESGSTRLLGYLVYGM